MLRGFDIALLKTAYSFLFYRQEYEKLHAADENLMSNFSANNLTRNDQHYRTLSKNSIRPEYMCVVCFLSKFIIIYNLIRKIRFS